MQRKKVATILFSVVLAVFFTSCGGGSSTTPITSTDSGGTTTNQPNATPDLQSILSNIESQRPSWDDLTALAANTSRASYPSFEKKINPLADKITLRSGYVQANLDYWDSLFTTFSPNVSPALINIVPPQTDSNGNDLTYPLTAAQMDEKLRAFGAIALREKEKGRLVSLINFYPPGQIETGTASSSDFKNWILNTFVPEVEAQAKAAELLKVEYYGPFPVEIEVFIENQQSLQNLSSAEKVTLAQFMIDQVSLAAKKFFTGRLIAHSYANYTRPNPIPYSDSLSFQGFDEIHFSLFPGCDIPTTESYVNTQLTEYKKIIERSGIPWVIGEFGVFEKYYTACDNGGTIFDNMESQIYQTVFNRLDAFSLMSSGVMVDDLFHTDAAKTEVKNYFATKTRNRAIASIFRDFFLVSSRV